LFRYFTESDSYFKLYLLGIKNFKIYYYKVHLGCEFRNYSTINTLQSIKISRNIFNYQKEK
jgi:hypothetical protein